ncbi:hypothetical protein MCHI_000294 [Candidatus Magnetoovum chiemensis]|nr:hypothetical protein MCHI_000294 [Candidatus Magnetoovum chiemensis]
MLHFLLKGNQPFIIALARGMKKRIEPELLEALTNNRLLIITPFESSVTRVTAETARLRNETMVLLSDEIVIAYAKKDGIIEKLSQKTKQKPSRILSDTNV